MGGHNPYCRSRRFGGSYIVEKNILVYGPIAEAMMLEMRAKASTPPQTQTTVLVEKNSE